MEAVNEKLRIQNAVIDLMTRVYAEDLQFKVERINGKHVATLKDPEGRLLLDCVSIGRNSGKLNIHQPKSHVPGQDYGALYYLMVARGLARMAKPEKLHSQDHLSDSAKVLWRRFEESGLAEKKDLIYEFTDLSQIDWKKVEKQAKDLAQSKKANSAIEKNIEDVKQRFRNGNLGNILEDQQANSEV